MIEGVIYKKLADSAEVTAIVAGRIHHELKPQDEREPSIVIGGADLDWKHTHGGSAGWARGVLRINAFADDKTTAANLAALCRAAVDNVRGATINGVKVGRFEVVRVAEIPRDPQRAKQRPVYGQLIDCDFVITETVT